MAWRKDKTPPSPPRPALSDTERAELAARWAQVACAFCGGWHGGLCNRVRSFTLDEQGRPQTTVFWEHWEENPRTIWPEDVWGSPSDMAQDMDRQQRERAASTEMQRVAAREAQRLRQEQSRAESPREIAARVARGG